MRGLDVFKVHESLGVPLDIILDKFKEEDCVVDWVDFISVSLDHNWNTSTTLKRIDYSLQDVYDTQYSNVVMSQLKILMNIK